MVSDTILANSKGFPAIVQKLSQARTPTGTPVPGTMAAHKDHLIVNEYILEDVQEYFTNLAVTI